VLARITIGAAAAFMLIALMLSLPAGHGDSLGAAVYESRQRTGPNPASFTVGYGCSLDCPGLRCCISCACDGSCIPEASKPSSGTGSETKPSPAKQK